jgi:hypothetical protein
MHRLQLDRLIQWISSPKPKPLVIRGARQTGKSTLVRNFAADHHLNLYEVNLEYHPEMDKVFQTLDLKLIIKAIESVCNRKFTAKNSLVFFDELQSAPSALAALRVFFDNSGDYFPVIAAGSLLEFTLHTFQRSMPVGRIEYLHLGPMTFTEFLIAMGEDTLVSRINEFQIGDSIDDMSHKKLKSLTRDFLAVGGMPEAVLKFTETESLKDVQAVQQFILDTYREDFYKYINKLDDRILRIIRASFDFVPFNAGRKIKYSTISRDDKAQYVRTAIDLLSLARVIHLVFHSNASGLPLSSQIDQKTFKCLFLDVGLMNRRCGVDWATLSNLDDIQLIDEGKIAEQFVGQHLLYDPDGVLPPEVFYWHREAKSSSAEVDFVMSSGEVIIPIEVKSGKSGSMKSLHQMMFEKDLRYATRFDMNPPSVSKVHINIKGEPNEYNLISLPVYLAGQWRRCFDELRTKGLQKDPHRKNPEL